jgi:hypothetical protein
MNIKVTEVWKIMTVSMEMEHVSPFFRVSLQSMLEECTESRLNFAYPGIFPEFKK